MKYAVLLYRVVCKNTSAVCVTDEERKREMRNNGNEKMIDKDMWVVPLCARRVQLLQYHCYVLNTAISLFPHSVSIYPVPPLDQPQIKCEWCGNRVRETMFLSYSIGVGCEG